MKVNDMDMLGLKDQKGTKLELCGYKLISEMDLLFCTLGSVFHLTLRSRKSALETDRSEFMTSP